MRIEPSKCSLRVGLWLLLVTLISPSAYALAQNGSFQCKERGTASIVAPPGQSIVAQQRQSTQRALLFEESRIDPKGKSYSGSVSWHTERVTTHPGSEVELAVQAEVDIPEQQLNLLLCIVPNDDQSIAASHIVMVMFANSSGASHGGISALSGIIMKRQLGAESEPLTGAVADTLKNSFEFALSSAEAARQRNLRLLKDDSWLDILIKYNDGLRAIVGLEKGVAGEPIFTDALATWTRADMTIDETARQVAQREIDANPGRFSDEARRNILAQKITLGMKPYEAQLAGGSCLYRVEADPKRWPRGSDPLVVIASQTDQPDDSKITLTFRNKSQFQTPELTAFRVEIRRGRVTEIIRTGERQ